MAFDCQELKGLLTYLLTLSRRTELLPESTAMSFEIPPGLTAMLQDFTVAVLRTKPPDIYKFAAEHFTKQYVAKGGDLAGVTASVTAAAGASPSPESQETSRKGKEMRFESPDSKRSGSEASSAASPGTSISVTVKPPTLKSKRPIDPIKQ